MPVVEALAREDVVVSIDTMRAEVARPSLEVGGAIINDVSGGLADPQMPALVARSGAPFVVTLARSGRQIKVREDETILQATKYSAKIEGNDLFVKDCVATAPTPASAQGTVEPTENQCDCTATPSSPVSGSRATME